MTTDEVADWFASFPKGTPVLVNRDDENGDVDPDCPPVELFTPIVAENAAPAYVRIALD